MYQGGYLLLDEPIVRNMGKNKHTAADLSGLSEYTVQAVNILQDTPWEINPFMNDLIQHFHKVGDDVGYYDGSEFITVLRQEKPTDPKLTMELTPKEVWKNLSREEKTKLKARRAAKFTSYEEQIGELRATNRIIDVAQEMSQFEKFYFPHNLCFRLRIYPVPTDLNPQSSDLSKGLLRFFLPTTLGKEGLFWLGFTCASHWGEDKLWPKERVEFSKSKLKEWEPFIDDPIRNRGWLKADKPFQFLATLYEYVWANRMDRPEDFITKIPGNLDGSCNGAQHLSIMVRDLRGATATNCRSAVNQRNDLYMEVADRVYEQCQIDARDGNEVALDWSMKLQDPAKRRKVVKRSVMTVPYGVTDYGVADFMIKDKHVLKDQDGYWDRAKYIRDLIMRSIDDTLDRGRKLQLWFKACATICAENGLPLVWDTPAGSKVTQAYRNVVERRIRSYSTRFVLLEEPEVGEGEEDFLKRIGMNVKKSATSAPPNVVHSCDAAHLQITTVRMHEAGIRSFSMIHDSFGCPMGQVGLMRDILRQSVVDMYAANYLETFKESVERYSGLTMPDYPELGEFDIQEILESEFFFA